MKQFYKNIHVAFGREYSLRNLFTFKINNNNNRRRRKKEQGKKLNNQPDNIIPYDSYLVING
jgi:hypothetical protein